MVIENGYTNATSQNVHCHALIFISKTYTLILCIGQQCIFSRTTMTGKGYREHDDLQAIE